MKHFQTRDVHAWSRNLSSLSLKSIYYKWLRTKNRVKQIIMEILTEQNNTEGAVPPDSVLKKTALIGFR